MMAFLHELIGAQGQAISLVQMSLRAVLIFVIGLLIVRFAAARAFGKWSALDIVLAVIVGSNLSRAITGGAPFLPTLAATILLVLLHGLLARASARWSWLSAVIKGRPVILARDGVLDEAAMKKAGLGEGDLRMALRAAGYDDVSEIRSASLERNGDITIIGR